MFNKFKLTNEEDIYIRLEDVVRFRSSGPVTDILMNDRVVFALNIAAEDFNDIYNRTLNYV